MARREPGRTPLACSGPGRGPWRVLWGFKSQVRSGRDSEHVEQSRPLQTHIQVKRMSYVCDMWDFECYQCRLSSDNAYLVMEKFSPTPTRQTCDHLVYSKINLHDLGRILLVSSRAYDHSMVGPFHMRPTAVRVLYNQRNLFTLTPDHNNQSASLFYEIC